MKRIAIISAVLFIALIITSTGFGADYWAKTYGENDYSEGARFIVQTQDGGFIVAGSRNSIYSGDNNIWILKLNSNGEVFWQKVYQDYSRVYSIQESTDGGYVFTGSSPDNDSYVIKLDSNGNITWQKTYGGTLADRFHAIQQTLDGGYIVAGYTVSCDAVDCIDVWILKLDSAGNITWQNTYGGSEDEEARSIHQTTDGGYIVAGYTYSFGAGESDFLVFKIDGNGNVIWQKTYGGIIHDEAYFIQQTIDGGYIVTGDNNSFGRRDYWVLKLDGNGNITWQKTYGGTVDWWDDAYCIRQTSDNGYIVAGQTRTFGAGYTDYWVLKLDSNGNVTWEKTYGGVDHDVAQSIQEISDGGYVVAGSTLSFGAGYADLWILKVDSNGEIPNCDLIGTADEVVIDTFVTGQDTTLTVQTTSVTPVDITLTTESTSITPSTLCSWIEPDADNDGFPDASDNCPDTPNGPELGTCLYGSIGETCMSDGECGTSGFCSMNQEDTDNDGSGDACDNNTMCKGNFDFDNDVDGTDASLFKTHFGRSTFKNPCPPDGPAPAEKSGQTTSFATGDDGEHQSGVPFPEPRFVDNGDGTVRDNLTGLIWLKNANCFGQKTWTQALSDCNSLADGQCGLTDGSQAGDWRLANLFELESLRTMDYSVPVLSNTVGTGHWSEGDPFINVVSNDYWSSTTSVYNTDFAWYMDLDVGNESFNSKTLSLYVWPVRGGH